MRVAFVVPRVTLAGGIGVVLEHARQLQEHHGHEVTLVTIEDPRVDWQHGAVSSLAIRQLADLDGRPFDVAVATWWQTCWRLFEVPAERYAYFVQSIEDRFYPPNDFERATAAATHSLPLPVITEARWMVDQLRARAPWRPVHYVRNGIDKQTFAGPQTAPLSPHHRPLHVVIEGSDAWFKGLPEALEVLSLMREQHRATLVSPKPPEKAPDEVDEVVGPLSHAEMATVFAENEVLLKLSRVEGMYGPPLEAFHMGATTVTTPVTGFDEYVVHGHNALVADFDDPAGTARMLDLLARDRRLLHALRCEALFTARAWPSWRQSGDMMALALASIREAPPLAPPEACALMVREGLGAGWPVQRHLVRLEADFERSERDVRNVVTTADELRALALDTGDRLHEARVEADSLRQSREMVLGRAARPLLRSRAGDALARVLGPLRRRRRGRRPRG